MALTNTAIRNLKPAEKARKVFDGNGLYIEISPKGGKWWRFKYRYNKKEKRISLGTYPEITLKEARDRCLESRQLLANGVDPGAHRKAKQAAKSEQLNNSFETVAREWVNKYGLTWSAGHTERTLRRLERDVFPWVGSKPITELDAPALLSVARRIEERGALETAHRAMGNCGQIFRYAIATGRATYNPANDLKGALPPVKSTHFPAITDPMEVGELLRAIDEYRGTYVVKSALKLAPLVFVRPGELRKAKWSDINLDNCEWRYLVTKTKTEHIVPLSTQAVEILKALQPLTKLSPYVFPSARSNSRPMSENAILVALRSLGIEKDKMSGHGFRAMARTILDEVLGVRPDFIEHQLAHAVRDPNGRAYNRTAHLPERRKMMQDWADYLETLKRQN